MRLAVTITAILLLSPPFAIAHRLDEYLQGTILSVDKNRVDAQVTLTPGVAVFPALIADMHVNADGAISVAEQGAYAGKFLRDISISIDGHPLAPHLVSTRFPAIEEMKEGRGEIQIEFDAGFPSGGLNRKLKFENRHKSRIAAYLVNCLVPRDRDIRIVSQNRNYSQSQYEMDFEVAGAGTLRGGRKPLETAGLLVAAWLALMMAVCGRPAGRLRDLFRSKYRASNLRSGLVQGRRYYVAPGELSTEASLAETSDRAPSRFDAEGPRDEAGSHASPFSAVRGQSHHPGGSALLEITGGCHPKHRAD